MVVLNKGDWVLYQNKDAVNDEPRLCKVTAVWDWRDHVEVWWVDIDGWGYASRKYLTKLPPELTPILSDSITTGELHD